MKKGIVFIILITTVASCQTNTNKAEPKQTSLPLQGTWQLISATLIENGITTTTDYTKNISFIKIINEDHFAFLQHDLNKGKDSTAKYVSGAGSYSLKDSTYTEHLEYCSAREWEGNDFAFTITINNDTLIQTGLEKVESTGVNRLNKETYVRWKK